MKQEVQALQVRLLERIICETKGRDARTAFNIEYKIREYVKEVLLNVLRRMDLKNYRTESERKIPVYGLEKDMHCRPDFEIMLKNEVPSMLIVEVKTLLTELLEDKDIQGYKKKKV